jgi:hypothetical protein
MLIILERWLRPRAYSILTSLGIRCFTHDPVVRTSSHLGRQITNLHSGP